MAGSGPEEALSCLVVHLCASTVLGAERTLHPDIETRHLHSEAYILTGESQATKD